MNSATALHYLAGTVNRTYKNRNNVGFLHYVWLPRRSSFYPQYGFAVFSGCDFYISTCFDVYSCAEIKLLSKKAFLLL
jgi:hypothetical protein